MENKKDEALTDEEIWERYNIGGGFREPGGVVAREIKVEDMPVELQERAREILKQIEEEEKR